MQRLSSKWTFWYKRAFPVFWFGFLVIWSAGYIIVIFRGADAAAAVLLGPLFMAIFGYFIMKVLILDLMDSVWTDGTDLVIRNSGSEERIPLTNIINVSHSTFTKPPRITLTVRQPCRFGTKITFSPIQFRHYIT